jgi:hypothetical protein
MSRAALLAIAVLVAGCATVPKTAIVDGREVPRRDLEFTGQPYSMRHRGAHPRPGSPSGGLRDAGGSIAGRVCGMLVDFDVEHKGDRVQLVGSIDNHMPSLLEVRDAGGARHISGNLGSLGVELSLAGTQLIGHVGRRLFALEQVQDHLEGFMRSPNVHGATPIRIGGRDALWAMPAADQAAVLANLLTCQSAASQYRVIDRLELGFGGTVTDVPPETSAVYTHSN